MGKEENKEMFFWTTEEYKKFSDAIVDKPISFYAFEMLYLYIFREMVRPFPHLAKPISTTFGKDERTMGQIKRRWFKTIFLRHERGFDYGRWKEKIQI